MSTYILVCANCELHFLKFLPIIRFAIKIPFTYFRDSNNSQFEEGKSIMKFNDLEQGNLSIALSLPEKWQE